MAQYDYMAPELELEGGVVGDGVPRLLGMRMDRKGGLGVFCHIFRNCFGDRSVLERMGPLTLKIDRATRPLLKFDRRHWTTLKPTGTFEN